MYSRTGKRESICCPVHFLVNIDNVSLVKCKYCSAKFNLNNCSSSPLIYHMKQKEKIKLGKADNDNFQNQYNGKQMAIQALFQKQDPPQLVLVKLSALFTTLRKVVMCNIYSGNKD